MIVAVFLRYSSLAALAAAVFGPIYFVFLFGFQPMGIALLIVCSLLIVIFLNKIWVHSNDDYKAVYQMIFEIIFATSTFLLLFVMWTLSEDENDKVINDHIETITYLLQKKQ
jgi:O-antigen/teichoic acid export membrane protein